MISFRTGTWALALLTATLSDSCAMRSSAPPMSLRMDYTGVEAITHAMVRESLTDADVDSLLRIHAVRATMVDNVHQYIPGVSAADFRSAITDYVRRTEMARGSKAIYFQLAETGKVRQQIDTLVHAIRASEGEVGRRLVAELGPYQPDTGPLVVTAYFVAGGVSMGFVLDDTPNAFYVNLTRADGDINSVIANMAHETYHVMQKAAARQVPALAVIADAPAKLPLPERLLATTLTEGTANYVVDASRSSAAGPGMDKARAQYYRNLAPAELVKSFALFDSVLGELRDGSTSWENAYGRGFTGDDPRFYFVGYQMARAIDRYCGAQCIGALFKRPPAEFLRQYIALYREHTDVVPRFSPRTEAFVASLP
ncbi:MAG: hypothetical protein JWM95_2384 [Gemmatimonadetes bacterium]|nr:hypothetical protein [Gemmatimonadota bacterium]